MGDDTASSSQAAWDDMFQQLADYRQAHGNCRVPKAEPHALLWTWIGTQRQKCKNGQLSPEQMQRMDGLDFVWEAADHDAIWEEQFLELKAYAETNGHCRVTRFSGPLGAWVSKQRQCRHRNSGSNRQLTEEQIARLDSIGFVWRAHHAVETWEAMHQKLREYKQTHGDCLVASSQGKLGRWVDTQRQRKDGPAGTQKQLTPEQIQLLDELGFAWTKDARFHQLWDKMFDELKDYAEEHGHCQVPKGYAGSGKGPAKLGKWVERQRARRKGQLAPLTDDQIRRLDAIGFVWSVRKRKDPPANEPSAENKEEPERLRG